MPDLDFRVESAEVTPFAAVPQVALKLLVSNASAEDTIHNVILRCQIMLEPARRRYNAAEQQNLRDLFGEPTRWGQTVRPMLWTHANTLVPPFASSTTCELPVPCTFDFNVAATKYFAGLSEGEIPLRLQFSGSIFYSQQGGGLQVTPIPWTKEATYKLPVKLWKELMDAYYPNSAWLCLRRDVFELVDRYKRERGIPTWEQALESLLQSVEEDVRS